MRIVQYMYDDSTTAVRCAVGVTEAFEAKVGLYQGSDLSPCLFAMVMIFADDIVICSEARARNG